MQRSVRLFPFPWRTVHVWPLTVDGCFRRSCAQRAPAAETLPARHAGAEGDSQVSEVRCSLAPPSRPLTACPLGQPGRVIYCPEASRSLPLSFGHWGSPHCHQHTMSLTRIALHLCRSTDLLIRRLPFARLVRGSLLFWRILHVPSIYLPSVCACVRACVRACVSACLLLRCYIPSLLGRVASDQGD